MKPVILLPLAYAADRIAGDPEWFPHPVRLIGHAISQGETMLRYDGEGDRVALAKGATLALAVVASSYCLSAAAIELARRRSAVLGSFVEVLLAWTCLAARNLEQEATSVADALTTGDLPCARTRLARIVGRDTASLDECEISRAVIETLAESASDGVVAPMFYMALGGVPLAMAYKAVNTLDSMIGHADARYLYFGKFAARLDDAANLLPARLTALAIAMASPAPKRALDIWHRDGYKHKSPNAGQPEAAISGALAVRLGGANTYAGELIESPVMGAEFIAPNLDSARRAIRLTTAASLLGLAAAMLLAAGAARRCAR
ncbi:adenosylcobinamide-phosphate synthase [Granulicella rosea]|uniref:Cobalamin biosynthesis protein CobD n=1 Tax=Granulicella rosea TaxID=474952 RepID=A0A239ILU7_9BACT|nr:adenosylcobinamide-phosphate synthase CbiB [Granulicella rosea]SNS94362.1 adenosylcobinamide-phosphate synthase [Granulicella rosea]